MVAAHRFSADAPASSEHIVCVDGVMGGRPTIRGTRITATSVFGRVANGDSIDDLMLDHPGIPLEAFEAALAHAAGRSRSDP